MCRKANFRGAKLNGAYMIKTVASKADFTGADVSDALWDRSVLVDAILRNAILERTVFTASDLTGKHSSSCITPGALKLV